MDGHLGDGGSSAGRGRRSGDRGPRAGRPPREPNPFGDRTTLRFTLPEAADARVEVLDLLGRRVALLADGPAEAGTHTVVWDGAGAPAGVYVVRLATGTAVRTLRVTRLR